MAQWIHECNIFRKDDFEGLLRDYNITSRMDIHTTHPLFLEVQKRLQLIENAWAKDDGRPPAKVILTMAPDVLAARGGKPLTPFEQWRALTFHNFVGNYHQIPWRPTIFEISELELLSALCHEAEHGAQSVGVGYTPQELQLIWIERSCKSNTEDCYWTRFCEMTARIKEAEWYIDILSKNTSNLSIYDKQAMLCAAQHISQRLTHECTPEKIEQLQAQQLRYLSHRILPARYLEITFPDTPIFTRNKKACDFLKQNAPGIYSKCFAKLQSTQRKLNKCITKWNKMIPLQVQQYEHHQENERLTVLAHQYNIPVLSFLPQDTKLVPIYKDVHAERYIQQVQAQYYNPAIILYNDKPSQLIYDESPIPRPYSITTALRQQWQSQNKDIDSNAHAQAVIYDEHDEECER